MTDQVLPSPDPVGSNEAAMQPGPEAQAAEAERRIRAIPRVLESYARTVEQRGGLIDSDFAPLLVRAASRITALAAQVDALTRRNEFLENRHRSDLLDAVTIGEIHSAELSSARDALGESQKRIKAYDTERDAMRKTFAWMLGEEGEFPSPPFPESGKPTRWYYWRGALRERWIDAIRLGPDNPANLAAPTQPATTPQSAGHDV